MPTLLSHVDLLPEIGTGIPGMAVTATLYVSPNGTNAGGKTWVSAYTTIQAALAAASTDADDCTLIMVSPHATNYDINTTGDPTYTGNYIIAGTHRNWAKVMDTHGSATSIMKFTGKASLVNLNFNLGTGVNGVIMTHSGFRANRCQFVGEDLESEKTALHLDGASEIKHGKVTGCDFLGASTTPCMTGILVDNCSRSLFRDIAVHSCKTAVQLVENTGTSDHNTFDAFDIGDCSIGFDFDAGDDQHVVGAFLHANTTNIADEVGNHMYEGLTGQFPIFITPSDLTGVDVTTGAAYTYGSDTEIRAVADSTKPFRVVGVTLDPATTEWYYVRFSGDSGATFYDIIQTDATRREGIAAPSNTGTSSIWAHESALLPWMKVVRTLLSFG